MAKKFTVAVLLVSAFCFSSLLDISQASDHFYVQGHVYCDPCRVQFETRLSHPLSGMEIHVQCKKIETGEVTTDIRAQTDQNGNYDIRVNGEHEEENCEVMTVASSHPECPDRMDGRDIDKIVLTRKNGVASRTRYVNGLGFMTKLIDPKCDDVLEDLGFKREDAYGGQPEI